MKFRNPFQSATDRLISKEVEHKLYEKASIDIENNDIDKGVWTKAFSKAGGDEVKQKAIYIELMVEHYRDEIRAGEEIAKVLATEAEKAKERQRQEEILRQERAEEERKAREEAERIRIRAEQWDADTESSTEENIINGFIVIIIIMTLFVLFKQF
jgi:hypothetical protein